MDKATLAFPRVGLPVPEDRFLLPIPELESLRKDFPVHFDRFVFRATHKIQSSLDTAFRRKVLQLGFE